MTIDLGERQVFVGYEGPEGHARTPVYRTVRATLEVNVEAATRQLLSKAATSKRGRSQVGGGTVVLKVVRL